MRLAQLATEERPREKLLHNGAESLTTTELLAILLRTGVKGEDVLELSNSLLQEWGGLAGLCRAEPAELMGKKGLKEAKAATLVAVLEIGKRIALLNSTERESWKKRLERIAHDTRFSDRENIFAVFLDARDRVIDEETISYGGQNGAYLDAPVFFRKAIRLNAHSVVLVHNHPDGSGCASKEDITLTDHVRQGLKILGIRLKGHYISADGVLVQVP